MKVRGKRKEETAANEDEEAGCVRVLFRTVVLSCRNDAPLDGVRGSDFNDALLIRLCAMRTGMRNDTGAPVDNMSARLMSRFGLRPRVR